MPAPTACPVERYARDVAQGRVVAGKPVRLACARHLRDLEDGHRRGLRFDREAAERAIAFFGYLQHSKGEWAGEAFILQPWEMFIVGSLFGWKRADGTRRFRTAYDEIPRKNGKSTLAAGVGLELLVADDEPGAEVYAAATKKDQARIVWSEAERMVSVSPQLARRIKTFKNNMHIPGTASKFEPLSSDEDSMDGLNIHGAIVDEVHAHKTRRMIDVLETATGSRRQPLIFYITTSGYDKHSVCWQLHVYGMKVLEGVIEDDTFFVYIATYDEGMDWRSPDAWAMANPNLGISVKLDDLERKCAQAKEQPAAQNAFRRLHLNEWTEQADRWIDIAVWDANGGPINEAALYGRSCISGLDLAATTDIAALAHIFPPDDEDDLWRWLVRFWVPEDNIRKRADRDRVPYDVWAREGFIWTTPGNVIDYDYIRADIAKDAARFRIREMAYDRWNATQLVTQLTGDGLLMVPFGQGFASMAAPTKEMEKLLLSRRFLHGGNPVLRWMMSNVTVTQDPAGNLKPDKGRSSEKIDGIVAGIMALGRAMVQPAEQPSVYETRGVLAFG